MRSIYLNIGSNRGDSRALVDEAVRRLSEAFPQALLRRSHTVTSPSWGYASENPFLNLGVALDFDGDMPAPPDVLAATQGIEQALAPDSPHRNADGSYRDRLLDIDIIHIDGVRMDTPELTLPHPRAAARRFVMEPMQVLCPGWSPDSVAADDDPHAKKTIADMARDDVATFRAKPKTPLCVVLDNIRSLNNIGSIFRTADAFAVAEIVLCGISAVPPSPQIHKTALGAEESMAWRYFATTAEALDALEAEGWTPVCLEQVHGSVPLQDYRPAPGERIALVAGNEVAGVDPDIVARCRAYLEIPQSGTKHSLNVAVSTAVALWHLYSLTLQQHG